MATYKKRGSKPKDRRDQKTLESQSTTAEVFNTLDETANKSEQWIEKNSKTLFSGLVVILVLTIILFKTGKSWVYYELDTKKLK